MDANGWRHILASKSFGKAGKELCTAIADFAKILCRRDIVVQLERSSSLEAYVEILGQKAWLETDWC